MKRLRIVAWVLVAVSIAILTWPMVSHLIHEEEELEVLRIGGPFSMTDHNGEAVTEKNYAGKAMVMFFGFTYCPDICPTTLARLMSLMGKLGPDAENLQVILVSVDPERDTPPVLKSYLAAFDPRFVGLTGTPEQLANMAKNYRIFYEKVSSTGGDYTMNHSAGFYLFKSNGSFQGTIDEHEAEDVAVQKLKRLLGA